MLLICITGVPRLSPGQCSLLVEVFIVGAGGYNQDDMPTAKRTESTTFYQTHCLTFYHHSTIIFTLYERGILFRKIILEVNTDYPTIIVPIQLYNNKFAVFFFII
jgi:hypothetical protein